MAGGGASSAQLVALVRGPVDGAIELLESSSGQFCTQPVALPTSSSAATCETATAPGSAGLVKVESMTCSVPETLIAAGPVQPSHGPYSHLDAPYYIFLWIIPNEIK